MANVFTKKYHRPRITTLRDFGGQDLTKGITLPEIRSPTRISSPHPHGHVHQCNKGTSTYTVWNPNFYRLSQARPDVFNVLRLENFSCGPIVISPKERGRPPNIIYTESTISRISYKDPKRYTGLQDHMKTTRNGYSPQSQPIRGIVPGVIPPEYKPAPGIV
ncbi:uncharacterized protein [Haliotis cracherodii]|uniref:uncharacterized protein n=1 Tax=Haliotis cracherodii TaxID=6455 RepID=UPI0039EA3E76